MPSKRLEFLQALRAFAVVFAVVYHFPGAFWVTQTGYAGVDLFFVISGYIMVLTTSGLKGGLRDAFQFAVKRLARIWPAYVGTSLVMAVVFYAVFGGNLADILRNLALSFAFYPQWATGAINHPGWTLNFEMYFYAVLAVSLLFGKLRWFVLFTIMLLGLVAAPVLLLSKFQPLGPDYGFSGDGASAYLALASNQIVWSFLIGVIVGMIAKSPIVLRSRPVAVVATVPGIVAVLYLMYVVGHAASHGPWWGAAFAAVILPLALHDKARPIWVPRPLVYVGDISYSIYVSHWLLAHLFMERFDPWWYSSRLRLCLMFALYVGSIWVVSEITHRLLEKRASDWLRHALLGRRSQTKPSSSAINSPAK